MISLVKPTNTHVYMESLNLNILYTTWEIGTSLKKNEAPTFTKYIRSLKFNIYI